MHSLVFGSVWSTWLLDKLRVARLHCSMRTFKCCGKSNEGDIEQLDHSETYQTTTLALKGSEVSLMGPGLRVVSLGALPPGMVNLDAPPNVAATVREKIVGIRDACNILCSHENC